MREERKRELLAYAAVCFRHRANPFATTHLQKKQVAVNECNDLADLIADSLEMSPYLIPWLVQEELKKAKREYQETQQ